MIVSEYTFRPMTRAAMVIERLVAESGHHAAAILAHVGECPFRETMLRMCREVMFTDWRVLDGETGLWRDADRVYLDRQWSAYSAALLVGFGAHAACPNCEKPCHPADDSGPFIEVDRNDRT